MAQEITNRAILTQTANRTKSNIRAKDYLAEVRERFPQALALQSIPDNEHLWELESYEEFLATRRQMLTTELNTFLEAITMTSDAESAVSLDELVTEGESDELEFKSSLRWSHQEGQVNKRLEQVILKSIAAFSNGEGGTLLVGVSDDGDVIGLEHDYLSLNGTKDEFELHLRNLVNQAFGGPFSAKNLKVDFPEIASQEICRIDIQPGQQPCYLQISDKHGQKIEKFYVRSGNSSQELSLREVGGYVQERFHG